MIYPTVMGADYCYEERWKALDEKKAPITLEEVWDVMDSVREDW